MVSLGAAVTIACVVQIALGADPRVLLLALVGTSAGLAGFGFLGVYELGAWVSLFYVLGNLVIAVCTKTFLGQAADSNLESPLLSFLVVDVGCLSLFLALVVVRAANVGKPVLRPTEGDDGLAFLSWSCFLLGAISWLLNRQFQDPGGNGFGGFALFVNLFLMAVIARTAHVMVRENRPRRIDASLVLILVVSTAAGLLENQKAGIALPLASYLVTLTFFRGGLSKGTLVTSLLCGVLFVSLVAPLTHIYRALDIQRIPLNEKIKLIKLETAHAFAGGALRDDYSMLVSTAFSNGYYDYFGDSRGQMIVGRYASIQQIDPVVTTVYNTRPLGGAAIWPALGHAVPSFINPEKPQDEESYTILVDLGLINPAGGKFPTLPLVGQAYAGYGFVGILIIPFATFLVFLLALKKITGGLWRNIYSIFFFCQFVIVYANQGDLHQYADEVLRAFPVFTVLFWCIMRAHGFYHSSISHRFAYGVGTKTASP